jgi:HEPN domain-containing protein
MRPFSIYYTNLEMFEQAQKKLLEMIMDVTEPDIVYLLGATLKRNRTESIFSSSEPSVQFLNNFYFLVVIPDSRSRPLHEWQEMIEQSCSKVTETVVIVVTTKQFFEWLEGGHRFARNVEQNAIKIVIKPTLRIPCIGPYDEVAEEKEISAMLGKGKYMASEFLAGAEVYMTRQNWNLAAFMLHQALEQLLTNLITAKTGYEQRTHNIKRLMKYIFLFNGELKVQIIKSNCLQKSELTQLDEMYYNSRYYEDFKFSEIIIIKLKKIVSQIISERFVIL